jgi:kynureninase
VLLLCAERANFPTDLYMLEGLIKHLGRGYKLRLVDSPEDLFEAIDSDVSVAVLTHVSYRTGCMLDMAATTAHAHARCQLDASIHLRVIPGETRRIRPSWRQASSC